MVKRTTLLLDEETRAAARDLAHEYKCSISEAIRRSVVRQRDAVVGVATGKRAMRKRALKTLFRLFADNDAAAEVRRLKTEDAGF
jgi:hypothetical protein